ncbi:hypothetical protein [Paenibacillus sp. FJAT-26967]|uniref:hypothetical protein n=1 Tax=Paenibacillus sp. FJAT-26967 TaxID=1729690 RepID=UPI001560AD0B|nr:hypothetical protein [Paenibacillus sp. FJAT-26967]
MKLIKQSGMKLVVTAAILAAPAAVTAVEASAQTVHVQNGPTAPAQSGSVVRASTDATAQLESADVYAPASQNGRIQEFTFGGPTFTINGPATKTFT